MYLLILFAQVQGKTEQIKISEIQESQDVIRSKLL